MLDFPIFDATLRVERRADSVALRYREDYQGIFVDEDGTLQGESYVRSLDLYFAGNPDYDFSGPLDASTWRGFTWISFAALDSFQSCFEHCDGYNTEWRGEFDPGSLRVTPLPAALAVDR